MNPDMTQIDMIAYFTKEGQLRPLKFRFSEGTNNEDIVVPVSRVLTTDINVLNGNLMHVFHCETLKNGLHKSYEIRYELKSNTWYLCTA